MSSYLPYRYQVTQQGLVLVFRGDRQVSTVGGRDAARLVARLGVDEDTDQALLQRATGHYKHGTERRGGR